jgi:hypothetical protein
MSLYNPSEYSDQENLTWCYLRAIEWCAWPVFVSQPIIPVLFLFLPWRIVVLSLVAINVLWALFIRHNLVIPPVATLAVFFVKLYWITIPVAVILLVLRGNYVLAGASLLWPWLAGIVGYVPGRLVGKTQKLFMASLGYEER